MPVRSFYIGAVTAICLAAFFSIALLSAQLFEHVPHSEDEVAYVFQAKVFAQNRLAVPTPPYARAFWTPFVLDYQGQRFGKYAPGWPALLSLGVRLGAPWLVNAGLGVLTLALIARLGRCFYRQPSLGAWAAGLGLAVPGFLFLSSSLLSHAASLFWVTVALWAVYRMDRGRGANYVVRGAWCVRITEHALRITHREIKCTSIYALLTGLSLGAAFSIRPFAAIGVGLPVGLFLATWLIRRELPWTVLPWLALGGLVTAGLLPLYWWAVTGDPTFNAYLLVWPYDRVGFGPDIGPRGYTPAWAALNTQLKLWTLATGLFGWPGWSNLLFLTIPFVTRRAGRWDWLLLGTVAGLVGVHFFYWAFGGIDGGFPRYYYDALPALLLLTARGISLAGEYLQHWGTKRFPDHAPGRLPLRYLPHLAAILLTLAGLVTTVPALLAAQYGKYGITAAPLRTVARANLAEPALVIIPNTGRWNDFAAPFAANSPTLDGPVVYAIGLGPEWNQALREHFAGRSCWELEGEGLRRCE